MASSGLSLTKSIGLHGQWGFSATFDLLQALQQPQGGINNKGSNDKIRLLLVHPGDIRHIICTLSRIRRHFPDPSTRPEIEIYLLEHPIELLARDLLLLELLLDFEVPIRQRANIFLEIFGNLKVQRRTSLYIDQLGKRLEQLLAKGSGALEGILDLSALNYRDRDVLEKAVKAFDRSVSYDMDNFFDHRKRGLYEDRYDSRKSIFDWDYHSGIKAKASIIHIKQFKQWRDTGIAFEFGDQQYTEPNKTFMTYTEGFLKGGKDRGLKKEVKGYWGDIVASPFFSLGVDCETPNKCAEGLFEIYNKNTGTEQHRHHAVEVALYNMFSFLWELETGKVYQMLKANDIYSGLGAEATIKWKEFVDENEVLEEEKTEDVEAKTEDVIVVVDDEPQVDEEEGAQEGDSSAKVEEKGTTATTTAAAAAATSSKALDQELAKLLETSESIANVFEKIKVYPMAGSYSTLLSKPKWKGMFDLVFVGSRYAQILGEDHFADLLVAGGGVVAVESAKFLVPLSQEVKNEFLKKEEEFAVKANLKKVAPPVPRRRRDEADLEDDVVFYSRS